MVFVKASYGDYGGIAIRATPTISYHFMLGFDQSYRFNTSTIINPLALDFSTAIHSTNSQSNQIAIIARGGTFSLYVNRQFLK